MHSLWGWGYVGSYSMTDSDEYFANGLMTYFDVQYPYDQVIDNVIIIENVWQTYLGSSSHQGGVVPDGSPVCCLLGQVVTSLDLENETRMCKIICVYFYKA